MKELLEQFCKAAIAAGYASADIRISGCVVCVMPKGTDNKKAAELFNATPALLAKRGLDGSVRCLPSDAGRAVVAQGLRPLPPQAQPKTEAVPAAPGTAESEPPASGPEKAGKKPGKKK